MKFEEMPYKAPNAKKIIKEVSKCTLMLKDAKSVRDAKIAIRKCENITKNYSTNATIISIRFSLDSENEEYKKLNDILDETSPLIGNAFNEFNKQLANSKFRKELEKSYGSLMFAMIDNSLKCFDEKIVPELIEENKLTSEYGQILASAQIHFKGNVYNLSQMNKFAQDIDRKTRKMAIDATHKWLLEHENAIGDIYSKLVHIRDQKAKKLGFKNYIELGYLSLGRLDYNASMVEEYRKQIVDHLVPLSNKLAKRQAKRLHLRKPRYYDWNLEFLSGNPTPNGEEEILIKHAGKMYHEMSKETSEFFDFMKDNNLLDLTARKGKQPGGYMTFIDKYKSPFIFSNFNGTSGDVDVLTHEMGHAFQGYLTRNMRISDYRSPTLEACEIHSMSMEFFAWPWIHLFFNPKDSEKYLFAHLAGAISFIPYGAAIDEFQHYVYENVDVSHQDRCKKWAEIDHKYRPYLDNSGSEFLLHGGRWISQSHVFQTPFYYIDYTIAQVVAFQFLNESRKDYQKAWKKYVRLCKLGGKYSFVSLLKHAHVRVPFEPGVVKKNVSPLKRILNSFDDKAL